MLVNTAYDLQNIRNYQGGSYALGRNIDAGVIPNFAPIPMFTGVFDGQGQTIANPRELASSAPGGSWGLCWWGLST